MKCAKVWKWRRRFSAHFFDLKVRHVDSSRSLLVEPSGQLPAGKLGEYSDKLGPIVGNQAESSDRRATIRSRSGLSFTADGNLYCSFLLKNGLLPCKTPDLGNLSEDSPTKNLGESSDTASSTKVKVLR